MGFPTPNAPKRQAYAAPASLSSRPAPPVAARRGPRVGWLAAMALVAAPLLLSVGVLLFQRMQPPPQLVIEVRDAYTGAPVAGAPVMVSGAPTAADDAGLVTAEIGDEPLEVRIEADGYAPVLARIEPGSLRSWPVDLRPTTLTGQLTDAASGAPIQGAQVTAPGPDGAGPQAATGPDGVYVLSGVPEGATLRIDAGDFGMVEEPVGRGMASSFPLRKTVVTGFVRDRQGTPIAGARVTSPDGGAATVTGPDGAYRLQDGAGYPTLLVSASGYDDAELTVPAELAADAVLERALIRSLYAPAAMVSKPGGLDELIEIARTTEINAIVVDAKEIEIFYDTQVPFFRAVPDMVRPVYDPAAVVQKLRENNIYSIARMVVFKDPLVAEARPDLDVMDITTGGPWRDMNGSAWVNAFYPELWQANADLAGELARFGFDEVQYDYIRFPSDGDLSTAEFGNDYTQALRREAITNAVRLGADTVRANGAKFSVDLFAVIAVYGDDQGIGQTVQDLTPIADYVSLMIYPSHFAEGNIPVDGHPNDFPGETIAYTLQRAEELVPGSAVKMRPWLQDFDYPVEGLRPYSDADVRAQIDATEAAGASGWILWNASGDFSVAALRPEG
ncbi:MAG: putative glycoside hydrolase [Chloroflexota bacterium]